MATINQKGKLLHHVKEASEVFFVRGVNMLTFAHGLFRDLDQGRRQGNQTVASGMLLNVAEGFKSGAVPHIVFSEGWKQYGEQSHPDSLKALDHFNIEFKVSDLR